MYDTYAKYIYEWLTNTFYSQWGNNFDTLFSKLDSILTKIDSILIVLQWGLYLGVFAFLFWVVYSILKPHLFKV